MPSRNRLQRLWRALLLTAALVSGLSSTATPAAATAQTTSTVTVTFHIEAAAAYGDTILVTSNDPRLGGWNPSAAVPLSTTPSTYPQWTATVELPVGSTLPYKYLRRSANGTVTWEDIPNRTLTSPSTGTKTVSDRWNVNTGTTVDTAFHLTATTTYGQNLYVVGDIAELGAWNPAKAVPLGTDPSTYPTWIGGISLPPSSAIQYKYVKKNPDGAIVWESGANRSVFTSSSGILTLHDIWR
ncbi:carbohydrate-binding module family 20 domain-containing protein [Streptomyces sp. NPDC056049]|uniref:carbohydrate-binding module family 20 domain-containing protein n=1 Tax=Streptomyces sp. NPDC056049 TaxID=3345693 RepID=UPI0035D57618